MASLGHNQLKTWIHNQLYNAEVPSIRDQLYKVRNLAFTSDCINLETLHSQLTCKKFHNIEQG